MAREKLLRTHNRILSLLVVGLSLLCGYLLSDKWGWLKPVVQNYQTTMVVREIKTQSDNISLTKPEGVMPKSLYDIFSRNLLKHTYSDDKVSLKQVAAILWSAQGVISQWGDRTAPSYRSAYPIELQVVVRNVEDLKAGVYRYIPDSHSLEAITASGSSVLHYPNEPPSMAKAPLLLVMSANTTLPYVELEAGQIAENVLLTTNSLNLGTTLVQSMEYNWQDLLGLPKTQKLYVIMPVGVPFDTQAVKVTPKPTIK